jgi:hypothetical protein
MSTEPWSKFYWADWRSDPKLRMCSLGARGLWMEMLSIMHESSEYGHLLVNEKSPSEQQLGIICGATSSEIRKCKKELQGAGVPEIRKDGVWFSRRMVRDKEKRLRDKANGAKGGNPYVKGLVNGWVNPHENPSPQPEVNHEDKARGTRDPEARSQIPEEKKDRAGLTDPAPPDPHLEVISAFDDARADIFGAENRRPFPTGDDRVLAERFLAAGAEVSWLKTLFLERMSKRKKSGQDAPDGLKYFEKAVPEALQRIAAVKGTPNPKIFQQKPVPVERTPEEQEKYDEEQRAWYLNAGIQHRIYNPEGLTVKEACA